MRHTDISGASARSWNTAAMPALRASRGDVKCTGVPYIVYSPELGWCTPDRILMNVDLPAPLSPSTQVTLPASTLVVMFSSAVTLPKYLQMLRSSRSACSPSATRHGERCCLTIGAHRASCAFLRMKLLTSTASSSTPPRKAKRPSEFHFVVCTPTTDTAMIAEPSAAPITDP